MDDVSVVIPNWNGEQKLMKNLPKVLSLGREVIVVDDGSEDQSVEIVKNNFPQVKLIVSKTNRGFSSAVNTGVKQASGNLIFLLNSDAIPHEDCLIYILPHFRNDKVFSVGCNSGGSWSWARFKNGYFWHFMAPKTNSTHQTLWVSGGSGVFRKKVWEDLGGLDELFNPFYEEDLDIGYRATKRGYINLWEPKALVEHKSFGVIKHHYSGEYIEKISQRNQLFFIWKNLTDRDMTRQHIVALVKKIFSSPKYFFILSRALIHFPAIYSQRTLERQEEKLSDKAILDKFELV